MNELERIKEIRSEENADITVFYSRTTTLMDGIDEEEVHHAAESIQGDQLSLIDWDVAGAGVYNYVFAVHDLIDGEYVLNPKMSLAVAYEEGTKLMYTTMWYETTSRAEKIKSILDDE